jgi:phosphoribosylformylglycinamidine synthase
MRAIKKHFEAEDTRKLRQENKMPVWPTDVELEVIAQTWSEHCKHKIFNAKINHKEPGKPPAEINSLYKTYIQGPTYELMKKRDDLLSVFEDNSGVVKWNSDWAVCFKVETHNSPSALEPYGGALTGILGVNRDVLGTGLGAKPIFNTDIFCFAYPSSLLAQRPKLLPPETIIQGVRRGVQDGGNKSGIPTVNGAIYFHDGYRAKPLVFCGTGGILPIKVAGVSGIDKHTQSGETIVMVGGRVGKDGIHGATFSSEALHEGSPVTAVQIGDPFTQKRVLDFVLEARDRGLITGITDNGAGGLSSSVGEMARITNGAVLELDHIPLKYPGLSDYEIVISESQERMTISTKDFAALKQLADKFNVECTDVGTFTTDGFFKVTRERKAVALLDLKFLHKGVPTLELESEWSKSPRANKAALAPVDDLKTALLELLSHPNVCSREQVIRQYDHEVQGSSVVKPLMGPNQKGPCDAAVITPLLGQKEGLVVSNGICPQLSEHDPHLMALCAVDEAIRNAVCVGADPKSITLLDNFCWPDPVQSSQNTEGKRKMAQLVMTCQGLAKAVHSYGTPLISGKDSMKNDFDDGVVRLSIPPTLLVSAMGKIENAEDALTMEFKTEGDLIYVVSAASLGVTASLLAELLEWNVDMLPNIDAANAAQMYGHIHAMVKKGLLKSAHDLSDGGLGVALSECCIGANRGALLLTHRMSSAAAACIKDSDPLTREMLTRLDFALFAEGPARLLVTVDPANKQVWENEMAPFSCIEIGRVTNEARLKFVNSDQQEVFSVDVTELLEAWEAMLPFD